MICFGIDVSKGKSTVTAISSDGVLVYPTTTINHNAEDIQDLANSINSLTESDEVRVVCESTGYYHWPIANPLLQKGIWVSILNPIITNKFSKNSLRNVKTAFFTAWNCRKRHFRFRQVFQPEVLQVRRMATYSKPRHCQG